METWCSSDLHLSHFNMTCGEGSKNLCGRPWPTVDEMDEALITLWNEIVAPGDEVYVLGDVAMGKISESLPLVRLLHGTKLLVPGNHDRCWRHHKKRGNWLQRYIEAGFTEIYDQDWIVGIFGQNRPVLMSHFPYTGDSHGDEDRYVEARPKDKGMLLFHGHVHDEWKQNGRQINVGVDVWEYKPVNVETLLEMAPGSTQVTT